MLRWSEEELVGKGHDVIFDLEDPAVSDLLDELIHSGSARAQLTYTRKDGTTFPGEVSTAFFIDNNGEPRTVAIIRDITERKRAEQEREIMLAFPRLINESKGTADLIHSAVKLFQGTLRLRSCRYPAQRRR